jgi:hypothetical protein
MIEDTVIEITFELLGTARHLTGKKQLSIELASGATHRDALNRLAYLFPALVGTVITPQTFELMPAFMLNLNGHRAINDLDIPVVTGERLVLMFVESGG